MPRLPILAEHEQVSNVGLLLVAGDRGLAGAFNSQIVRAGRRRRPRAPGRGPHARSTSPPAAGLPRR